MVIYTLEEPATPRNACLQLLRRLVSPEAADMLQHHQKRTLDEWAASQDRESLTPRLARVYDIASVAPGARSTLSCAVARVIEQEADPEALQGLVKAALR